jgi:hypothetical protein
MTDAAPAWAPSPVVVAEAAEAVVGVAAAGLAAWNRRVQV